MILLTMLVQIGLVSVAAWVLVRIGMDLCDAWREKRAHQRVWHAIRKRG